jgi:hypothetical protein
MGVWQQGLRMKQHHLSLRVVGKEGLGVFV